MKPILKLDKAYRASKRWKDLRTSICSLRGFKCETCGAGGNLHVHHKTYENFGNESIDDLELLCAGCHRRRHIEEKMLDVTHARKMPKRWIIA